MKKTTITINILSLALLAGAVVLQYFAARKLGFVRWLNYYNQVLNDAVPFDMLKLVVLAVVLALALLCVLLVLKYRESLQPADTRGMAFAVILLAVYVLVTLAVTHEVSRADFLIVPLVALAALLQLVHLGCIYRRVSARAQNREEQLEAVGR